MKQESGQDNVQDIFQRYEMLSAIAPYAYVVVGDGEIFNMNTQLIEYLYI